MRYYYQEKRDALLPSENPCTPRTFHQQATTADVRPEVERDGACHDYSEEAIPERDPAYDLPVGTGSEPTVTVVSAEVRREMARRLQELGMSRARATLVASL